MLSASWERAAKPGAPPPAAGAPDPSAGRHLSSPELGVCLTIKATTFYSVCTEPKQTTVYRLLFSFLFEMRHFSVLCPVIRPVYSPFPPTMAPADWPKMPPPPPSPSPSPQHLHGSTPTCEGMGTRPGASVHHGHMGSSVGPWGLLCMRLFNTMN